MKSVVVHSGGMDSSICLALAIRQFSKEEVISLSFDYEQRHALELEAAARIAGDWGVEHQVIPVDVLKQVTDNALMNQAQEIRSTADSLVVGRNGLMARLAAIYAHHRGARAIVMGVLELETDYRDCSRHYMDLMQEILRIDLADNLFEIQTPLIALTKAETMHVAEELGVLDYLLEHTVTCYRGIPREGCGNCPSCLLRQQGLEQYRASLV